MFASRKGGGYSVTCDGRCCDNANGLRGLANDGNNARCARQDDPYLNATPVSMPCGGLDRPFGRGSRLFRLRIEVVNEPAGLHAPHMLSRSAFGFREDQANRR